MKRRIKMRKVQYNQDKQEWHLVQEFAGFPEEPILVTPATLSQHLEDLARELSFSSFLLKSLLESADTYPSEYVPMYKEQLSE